MRIKVCGVTTIEDAEGCSALGVDLLGLNFVPSSPRRVSIEGARRIAERVRGKVEIVGVTADLEVAEIRELALSVGLDLVQLHGDEPPELVMKLGGLAFKALRMGDAADVAEASRYAGLILADAKAPGQLGGTGKVVDFSLVAPLARSRPLLLAGGLTPANVAAAIEAVGPFGVDVASGVEKAPGVKDLDLVGRFVSEARKATRARRA